MRATGSIIKTFEESDRSLHPPDDPRRDREEVRKNPPEETVPKLAYSAHRQKTSLAEASDRDLLWALAKDDELALAELVARKTRPLLQVVGRIVADAEEARDIVQVTFLRLWENRERFDDRWSPNTWIYRIATNLAIDHWRSRRSRERATEPMRLHLVRSGESAAEADLSTLEGREVARIFDELSRDLSDRQRLVFLLREVEGLSSAEVAVIAGCEESTVRNHLFNARKHLRVKLLERFPEYGPARDGSPEEGS
jgi:RNA polymerase sigma-70 factor (ECF subfamily)